ncbi:MAG TPA: hypothetical protein VHT91_24575, partial [Kofleriaceae bacterium]|nr:hypothetical protein [Kofleriaceae bacterium]
RDTIVDFVRVWSDKTEIAADRFVAWIGMARGKFFAWKKRYGKANEHNGYVPRDHWLLDEEKRQIIAFHERFPLEGYLPPVDVHDDRPGGRRCQSRLRRSQVGDVSCDPVAANQIFMMRCGERSAERLQGLDHLGDMAFTLTLGECPKVALDPRHGDPRRRQPRRRVRVERGSWESYRRRWQRQSGCQRDGAARCSRRCRTARRLRVALRCVVSRQVQRSGFAPETAFQTTRISTSAATSLTR